MKEILIKEYNNTEILGKPYAEPKNNFSVNFVEGALFEVKGPLENKYKVTFSDKQTGKVLHSSEITNKIGRAHV